MSTAIYPNPLTCRLGCLWLTLIRSCADSFYRDRLWLYLMPTLSTVIKHLLLICRLCRLRYTLILSCVDSVDCDWHWLELVPTLSTVIDPPKLIFWHFWLWSIAMAQVSTLLADMDRDCSWVGSVDCDWSWLAQVLILSNVIDPVWLMCRFCQLRSTWILSFLDSLDCNHFLCDLSALVNTDIPMCQLCRMKSTPDKLICRHCRMKRTLINPCVNSVYSNWPWLFHVSTLSNEIHPELLLCRLCRA